MTTSKLRRLALALLTGTAIAVASLPASVVVGALTPAYAQASEEFQQALEPYGQWRQHPRWGDIWVPDQRPRGWRPYSVGHWVYTDDWGWYWISDDDEADWGWVTYHYGRWISERGRWFWVPGEDWSPAWVDWRRGDRYVGWAPLPPDDVIYEYGNDPSYWTFVEPRYVTAPRVRTYFVPMPRTRDLLRTTVIVNRAFRSEGRVGVNPGISPAFIGAAARRPIETYQVRPRVLAGTQGVSGAVTVRPEEFRQRGAPRGPGMVAPLSVQRTTTVIQPATSVPPPQPLRQDERGRLGTHPPRAAQGVAPAPVPQRPSQQQAPASLQQQPAPMTAPAGGNGAARTAPPPASTPAPPPSPGMTSPPAGSPPPLQRPAAAAPPPPPAPPPSGMTSPPPAAPSQRSATPPPAGTPPQARPERPIAPQTPPPQQQQRQSAPPPGPPPAARPPAPPPPPGPPSAARPSPPAPPPAARPAPPPPPPAPPPVARPAAPPPPPPAAVRPPPPPPAAARPAPPPPAAARPAPPAGAPAKPPRKPGEPEEKK